MKNHILLALLTLSITSGLFSEEQIFYSRLNEQHRYVEGGLFLDMSLANNALSTPDIFHKHLVIDAKKINRAVPTAGNGWHLDFGMQNFLNITPSRTWGIGGFVNADARFDMNVPKSFFKLLTEGNWKGQNDPIESALSRGTFTMSGAAFAETGILGRYNQGPLRINAGLAYFQPAFYLPKSTVGYTLDTRETLLMAINGNMNIYLPFNPETGQYNNPGGGDLFLAAEYSLYDFVDFGASLSHIPIIPARLTNKISINFNTTIFEDDNIFDGIKEVTIPELDNVVSTGERWVVRPLRFDVYALLRPLRTDLLVIRPNIGFTALNPSEETYFNWGLEGQLNLGKVFFLALNTGLEEGLWRHNLGFALNARIIEFYLRAGLASQDFVKSFQLTGFRLTTGVTIGF